MTALQMRQSAHGILRGRHLINDLAPRFALAMALRQLL